MKYQVTLLAFLILGLISCQNKSNAQAPEAVKKSFQAKYPGENDPDWHQDANGSWEANFKIDGEKYRADYNSDGSWIETENSLKKKNLPEAVLRTIKEKFGNEDFVEAERVDHHSKGIFYDIEFKQKGKNLDIEMREDGTILN
ncbi:hypothetical protein EAX61_07885 [Dokdonia sinensis]|uniref:Putative beta-lactamase-inhibitor-like PepSY-like domain-containing protein n=1 Tax=Dokdonia sinensis TaxID=2479847 RepID=A0A3M0GQE4_9FLAO|nr:PepSY-like domain-containing protein [Dokdonia sinensis]RMB59496.1 hypothetical protein EAX61_07885 [Dokdonia sinensis]